MEQNPKKFSRRILKNPGPFPSGFEFLRGFEDGTDTENKAKAFFKSFEPVLQENQIDLVKDNSKVLEIGSGSTKLLDFLKKNGVNVIGLDINLRGSKESPQVVARAEQLPFPDESFNVIFSIQAFDNLVYDQDHNLMMKEIARVMKQGGIYIGGMEHISSSVKPIEGFNLISDPSDKSWRVVYRKD